MSRPAQLSAPGRYRIDALFNYFFVEVDEELKVHQLKPATFERDGVLADDRWGSGPMKIVKLPEAK